MSSQCEAFNIQLLSLKASRFLMVQPLPMTEYFSLELVYCRRYIFALTIRDALPFSNGAM